MIKASEVISSVRLKLLSSPVSEAAFVLIILSTIFDKVRESLSDTVEPYRWNNLDGWGQQGIGDIKQKRIDASYAYNGTVLAASEIRDSFASALYHYVLARAYDKDAGISGNNLSLSQENDKHYLDILGSVSYFYPATILLDGINNGIQAIIRYRPDVLLTGTGLMRDPELIKVVDDNIDLDAGFKNALINYCAYEAVLAVSKDLKQAGLFLTVFKQEVSG